GPLTQEQTREQMFIATEGLEGLDEAEIDLQTVLSNENRKVEASLEATPASADAAEAAEIRKNLLTGNNESGTHAPA
ncbi:hypothetical protein HOD24_03010, partial [Candidatus Peregrinibacteria bacterium]|nr:hypothetical protein [Candidatus Peregrinibacteria bacterium]